MTSGFTELAVDCRDPERLAAFRVPDGKSVENPLHLDEFDVLRTPAPVAG
ncbi:hypothetical protein [Streptomyces sp. NPDC047130]